MKMSQESLNKLANLLKNVIGENNLTNVMKISNPQYSDLYLKIFLDETEKNKNEPIGYDDFCSELFVRLDQGINNHENDSATTEFMRTWNAWFDLYKYLNKEDKLKHVKDST